MDVYEDKLLDATDLDTFNILCSFAIFISNTIGALYIVWRVVPVIKSTNSIDLCFKSTDLSIKTVNSKSVEPATEIQLKSVGKPTKKKKPREIRFDLSANETLKQLPKVKSKESRVTNGLKE